MTKPAPPCPCGTSGAHRIARRLTYDGKQVELWSDGCVTADMGFGIRGIGTARSDYECSLDVKAGWLAFGEIELYDGREVSRLVQCARRAVRQRCEIPRTAMLRYFRGERIRTMKAGRTFQWVRS